MMGVVGAVAGVGMQGTSRAATYSYVDWTDAAPTVDTMTATKGTAKGTITVGGQTVTVTFAAINADGSAGTMYSAQWKGDGAMFWMPATPYMSPQVENPPPGTDILQLSGGMNQTYRVTLSEPIKDPVMAILSLGQPGVPTTYDFDSPFTIVSQGAGYFGGGNMALKQLPGDVLEGSEGHGTIQFIGVFSTFSWTVPTPETWHGFTFAIRTTEALEPSDAGSDAADAASTADAAPAADAASTADTAAPADAGTPADAATAVDAGGKGKSDDCDCALGGGRTGSASGLPATLFLLGLGAWLRRRNRRSGVVRKSGARARSSRPA